MTRASVNTLLSLDRYSQIMGINPVHFAGATAGQFFPVQNNCADIWLQHAWQFGDSISREELARAIYDAEQDIASVLGYYPAPVWISQEIHRYPRHHRRDLYRGRVGTIFSYNRGNNVRGQWSAIKANYAKIIQGGRRAVEAIETGVTVVYSDVDSDGFWETATVTVTLTDAQVAFGVCSMKVYFAGQSGVQSWEIRPVRSKTISGNTLTVTFWSWQFIRPELWESVPFDGGLSLNTEQTLAINIEGNPAAHNNFVTTVDVYREYNDFSQASSEWYWEPQPQTRTIGTCCGNAGCPACEFTTQEGCIQIRDAERGLVAPVPATYDSTNEEWDAASSTVCRDPDQVKLWYYAGDLSQENLAGADCQQLSNYWAQTIAWLATARVGWDEGRDLCSCGNVRGVSKTLRQDLAFTGETAQQLSENDLNNPFGTKRGAIMAWKRVSKMSRRLMGGGVV